MKTLKKALCALLCAAALSCAAGCWNKQEPQDLAIIHSMIYDVDEDGQFILTVEIMNPSDTSGGTDGGGGTTESLIAVGKGESVREAVSNVSKSVEKFVFAGHNKARIFTERFAESEIPNLLDFLCRDHLTDEMPIMIVIKGKTPEEVHFCSSGFSDMIGDYFKDLSKIQREHTSKAVFVTTLDFIKDYLIDGKQPVTGVAELKSQDTPQKSEGQQGGGEQQKGDKQQGGEKKLVLYEGLAAFKDGKLAGFLNGEETRAYNILINDLGNAYITIPSGDGLTVFKIEDSRADITASVNGGDISFYVNIQMILNIREESGGIDISKDQWLKIIEQRFNEKMQEEIKLAIQKVQREFASDIFGFGRHLHLQLPEKWREFKNNWDDYFAKAVFYVTVDSTVNRTGQIKGPFKAGREQ
ncbi:MAG: Ger(x)C family spore germination protein [Christensenellales bacterium]